MENAPAWMVNSFISLSAAVTPKDEISNKLIHRLIYFFFSENSIIYG